MCRNVESQLNTKYVTTPWKHGRGMGVTKMMTIKKVASQSYPMKKTQRAPGTEAQCKHLPQTAGSVYPYLAQHEQPPKMVKPRHEGCRMKHVHLISTSLRTSCQPSGTVVRNSPNRNYGTVSFSQFTFFFRSLVLFVEAEVVFMYPHRRLTRGPAVHHLDIRYPAEQYAPRPQHH